MHCLIRTSLRAWATSSKTKYSFESWFIRKVLSTHYRPESSLWWSTKHARIALISFAGRKSSNSKSTGSSSRKKNVPDAKFPPRKNTPEEQNEGVFSATTVRYFTLNSRCEPWEWFVKPQTWIHQCVEPRFYLIVVRYSTLSPYFCAIQLDHEHWNDFWTETRQEN